MWCVCVGVVFPKTPTYAFFTATLSADVFQIMHYAQDVSMLGMVVVEMPFDQITLENCWKLFLLLKRNMNTTLLSSRSLLVVVDAVAVVVRELCTAAAAAAAALVAAVAVVAVVVLRLPLPLPVVSLDDVNDDVLVRSSSLLSTLTIPF